jgi:hypothetical protein
MWCIDAGQAIGRTRLPVLLLALRTKMRSLSTGKVQLHHAQIDAGMFLQAIKQLDYPFRRSRRIDNCQY